MLSIENGNKKKTYVETKGILNFTKNIIFDKVLERLLVFYYKNQY